MKIIDSCFVIIIIIYVVVWNYMVEDIIRFRVVFLFENISVKFVSGSGIIGG